MKEDLEYRVEIANLPDEGLEIRYFKPPNDPLCLSWRIPKEVASEVIEWWKKWQNEQAAFPVKEKTRICEFTMNTGESINIRELDRFGRYKPLGWSLPKGAVEELISRGK